MPVAPGCFLMADDVIFPSLIPDPGVSSPGLPVARMFLGMVTRSSELRAQSTMPLQPFRGKLMSAWPTMGRLWTLNTGTGREGH
ncbi:hypothetical protein EYF80_032159 [Liparis tanakae]|uniref:Uncharacterized protein n=1 Tax=Liparis tanakae TaxID=230148 RepID=A0A4Z2GVZ7_9TELE|nr:hypothetical protein EYF80_032159 [Liparis tanakae]